MRKVPCEQFWQAVLTATKLATRLPDPLYQQLCKRTEIPSFIRAEKGDFIPHLDLFQISDEMAHRVDLMLGVHAETVFRVWVLQTFTEETS